MSDWRTGRDTDVPAVRYVPTLPSPKKFPTPPRRTWPEQVRRPTWLPPGTPIPCTASVVGHDGVTPTPTAPRRSTP